MPTKSILLRRTLAIILFFNSTIGVLLLLPKNPLTYSLWYSSPDTPVYVMIIFLILNLALLLSGFLFSQNMQFLITFRGLDERAQSIKKDIILKSFPGALIILVSWLFLQYLMVSQLIYRGENAIITLDDYWNKLAGYFVFVPVLLYPFVVALWNDKEIKITNPFLSLKTFTLSIVKVIFTFVFIGSIFATIGIITLKQPRTNYQEFNKSEIYLQGDINFEITIDPALDVDSLGVASNIFSHDQMMIDVFGEFKDSDNGFKIDSSYASLNYNAHNNDRSYLTDPKGSLYFVAGYRWPLTHQIFGTPTAYIQVKELKALRILNTKSVKITTKDNKCLDKDTFKFTREGIDRGNLELPCNLQIKDIKNMEDAI